VGKVLFNKDPAMEGTGLTQHDFIHPRETGKVKKRKSKRTAGPISSVLQKSRDQTRRKVERSAEKVENLHLGAGRKKKKKRRLVQIPDRA